MLGFEAFPPRVRVYIGLVITLACGEMAWFVTHPPSASVPFGEIPILLVLLTAVGLLAELKPMVMPSGEQRTVFASVLIASVMLLGPGLAIIPAILSVGIRFIDSTPDAPSNSLQRVPNRAERWHQRSGIPLGAESGSA